MAHQLVVSLDGRDLLASLDRLACCLEHTTTELAALLVWLECVFGDLAGQFWLLAMTEGIEVDLDSTAAHRGRL